jgi:hypothetical protein
MAIAGREATIARWSPTGHEETFRCRAKFPRKQSLDLPYHYICGQTSSEHHQLNQLLLRVDAICEFQ